MDTGIAEVSRLLSQRADSVVEMLFPMGKRVNGHMVVGDISGASGESLKIEMHGPHVGNWRDWASDDKGDLLDLWSRVRGISLPEAYRQARTHLGIADTVRHVNQKEYAKARSNDAASEAGQIRKYLTETRRLENAIVNRFRIGTLVREEDGKKRGYIVYPCYSPEGVLVNNSYCALLRSENGKKKVFQDTGCAPAMFGWQALDARAYTSRKIVICEGQIDAMTWTQWGFDCLSIPNGGGNTWIEYEWENLAVFETIYLSYDMDGKLSSVQESAIQRLGKHRCMLVKLPHKDANAALQAGMTSEQASEAIAAAKAPRLENFSTLKDLKERVIKYLFPDGTEVKIQPPIFKSPYPEKTFTVRPGEITLWTGISHHGKSSLLSQVFIELVMLNQVVFIASFEMKPERTVKKMAMCAANGGDITRDEVEDFVDALGERMVFFDRVGSTKQDELFEMMRYARAKFGATQFMIDSLMRVEGLDGEYSDQSAFMNEMCKFAAENMVHIHMVAHPKKTVDDAKPGGNDIKGSSTLRNQADNVVVVYRNHAKEQKLANDEITKEEYDAEWDTSLTVEKDREEGNVKAFKYKYEKRSERFIPMTPVTKTFVKKEKRKWNQ